MLGPSFNLLQHTLRRQQTRRDPSNYETYLFNEGLTECVRGPLTFYSTLYNAIRLVGTFQNMNQHTLRRQRTRRDLRNMKSIVSMREGLTVCAGR